MKVIAILVLGACADPTLSGTYEGQDTLGGTAEFPATWVITLEEPTPEGEVAGRYEITGIGLETRGGVAGTFAEPDSEIVIALMPEEQGECRRDVTATWDGDTRLIAEYTTAECFAIVSGALTLAK